MAGEWQEEEKEEEEEAEEEEKEENEIVMPLFCCTNRLEAVCGNFVGRPRC